ncbi:sigma-70 family RNA polymerase sigma factor [Azospirillum thermophilum]|uniref:RNA polymerase subunit sigma n=1 Tax=Azospirillum thermophilum TaxID=2202148 RepID=A0A2S2CZX3_9PROT|nr:sigma-70 family RNA polymerase sigma factor [Azospirillum thermophilum]AWK89960.1 RNA polymerase subunit sigma [Azospirillum thermophilum]
MFATAAQPVTPPPDPPPDGAAVEPLAAALRAVAERHDRQAFALLFGHFAPRVKAYMLKLGMPQARAEDLAQETMLTVWRKAGLYDPARAEPATWVFTIARNLRIDALRRERHPEVSDELLEQQEDDRPPADALLAAGQRARRLRAALAGLSPEQAEVVRLSFFADLAHPAIAERLNLPLGTVKSRLRLALGKIRKALGDEDP